MSLLAESIFAFIEELSADSVEGYAEARSQLEGERRAPARELVRCSARPTPATTPTCGAAAAAGWPPRAAAAIACREEELERIARRLPADAGGRSRRRGLRSCPTPRARGARPRSAERCGADRGAGAAGPAPRASVVGHWPRARRCGEPKQARWRALRAPPARARPAPRGRPPLPASRRRRPRRPAPLRGPHLDRPHRRPPARRVRRAHPQGARAHGGDGARLRPRGRQRGRDGARPRAPPRRPFATGSPACATCSATSSTIPMPGSSSSWRSGLSRAWRGASHRRRKSPRRPRRRTQR